MRLLNVRLHGFGQFNRGLDVSFAPDRLNVVVGRNEAGKSTLLNAVGGVLFGFRDLNMVRKYEPWEEHDRYAGEAKFQLDDGRRFRVERDFRTGEARIVEETPEGDRVHYAGSADPRGGRAEDALYYDLLGELLGFQDEAVFRNTAFVGQSGLKAEVSEQIRRLLSGSGDADYKGALHELHSRHADLTADNPWRSRGPVRRKALELAREAAETAEQELREAEARARALAVVEDEADALDLRRERETAEAEARRETRSALETACALAEKRAAATARREETGRRLEQARRVKDKADQAGDRIRREFAAHRKVGDDFLDVVTALTKEREEQERALADLGATRTRLGALQPVLNTKLGVGLALGLALSAGGATWFAAAPIGAVVIAAGAAALVGWTAGRRLGTGYAAEKRELEERVRSGEQATGARARRISELEGRTGQLLVGRTPEAAADEHREYRALLEEGRRATSTLKALGDVAALEAVHAESVAAEGRLESAWHDVRSRRPWIAENATPAELAPEIERARRAAAEAEADVERTRARAEDLRVERTRLAAQPESDVAGLHDVARRERRRATVLDLEKDALKETIDVLDGCLKEFRENDVFRLADDMSRLFAKLTGDKYLRVQLGPSLEPAASTADRSGIPPEDLSQGAHDQLYFAMRMAVVAHLAKRETSPIFLDDPFVNFDAERLAAARGILRGMEGRQCILVTCDRQYEAWTDAVVDLDLARAAAD